MIGHLKYTSFIMSLDSSLNRQPNHEVIHTAEIQEADLLEINIVQAVAQRFLVLPKFVHLQRKTRRKIFPQVVMKLSSLLPRGSKLRILFGKVVWSLPINLRTSIIRAIAPGPASVNTDLTSYSIDLGFGIKTSTSPMASLIIPVHNHWFTTLNCLTALQRNSDSTPYEVILVDDASSDLTVEAALNIRGITVIKVEKNIGYLRATNLGASYAAGKYLVLLNNDTEPVTGWLDSLVKALESDSSVAIAGSTLLYPDGTMQEAGGQIFSGGNAWNLGRGGNPKAGQFRFPREVDYLSAASMIVRKDFWVRIGGFDERYVPAYCEDSDLCLTAWDLGLKVKFVPESWVIHHEGISHGKGVTQGLKSYQIANTNKLREKWQNNLASHWADKGVPRLERLRDSKGIVFIADAQLPAATRDAGSIRTIQIIKHLLELKYHVVLTALDPSTTEIDMDSLRQLGVEVHQSYEEALSTLATRASRITHAWLIRGEIYEFFSERILQYNSNIKLIADLMDLNYVENSKSVQINTKQVSIANSSNITILVSEVEARILQNAVPDKKINVIWAEYDPIELENDWISSEGLIFVGGFRHEPNVEGILWFSREVVPHLKKAGFTATIRVVGSGLTPEVSQELKTNGLSILGRQDSLLDIYRASRIAIIPLLSGRGRKGKLGEALAAGVPVVTTSVGAEGFALSSNKEIRIADDAESFAKAIIEVHDQEILWNGLKQQGLKYSSENLSSIFMAHSIEGIMEGTNE